MKPILWDFSGNNNRINLKIVIWLAITWNRDQISHLFVILCFLIVQIFFQTGGHKSKDCKNQMLFKLQSVTFEFDHCMTFSSSESKDTYLLCSLQNLTLVESLVSLIYEVPDLSMLPRFELPFESFERYCYKPTFLLWRIDSFCKKFLLVSTRARVEGSEELKAVANHRHNLLPLKNI